jgi:hypothetical protein
MAATQSRSKRRSGSAAVHPGAVIGDTAQLQTLALSTSFQPGLSGFALAAQGNDQTQLQQLQPLNFEELVQAADPKIQQNKQLFNDIGTHCRTMDTAYQSLRTIVGTLRSQDIWLEDDASILVAKSYILETHSECLPKTIDKYVSNLRQLLRCPPEILPECPSITVSLPAWQTVGDEVDVPFGDQVWHGVVVSAGHKSAHIYWVGCAPKQAGRRRSGNANPAKIKRKSLRWHQDGALQGSEELYSVAWIKENCVSRKFGAEPGVIFTVSSCSESSGEEDKVPPGDKAGSLGDETTEGAQPKPKPKPDPKPKPGPKPKPKPNPKSGKGSEGSEGCSGEGSEGHIKKGDMKLELKRHCKRLATSIFHFIAPFVNCNDMMQDLLKLGNSPSLQANDNFFRHYLMILERLRFGQGCMYHAADAFRAYFEQQAAALRAYDVHEVKFDERKYLQYKANVDKDLVASYTFAFTRNELVIISCLLANPGLSFCNILQKTGCVKSIGAFRGMAYVPEQLENFFHQRLLELKLIDRQYHPEYMQGLSTVVLNSTYCHEQLGTWNYGEEWKSKKAKIIKLANFPSCFSIDGMYAEVHHKFENGLTAVVYAQVMSQKASQDLGVPKASIPATFSLQYAHVLLYQASITSGANARIVHWSSLGKGQVADPICVAKFKLQVEEGLFCVDGAEMFSHLDSRGVPVYQALEGFHPTATQSDFQTNPNVGLEYGPDIILTRIQSVSKPAPLLEQLRHCDGNFYHAKGEWREDESVHGNYRLSNHRPLLHDSEMENKDLIEPLFLKGSAHQNSLSMLIGINQHTTLTFPPPADLGSRQANVVQPAPFGGLKIVSFVKEHMGSAYGINPNERPHVYAHSSDLRQFPVSTAGNLIMLLGIKQRIENIRERRRQCTPTRSIKIH